jgi:SPP1 family predicted phage head-tail adaptor
VAGNVPTTRRIRRTAGDTFQLSAAPAVGAIDLTTRRHGTVRFLGILPDEMVLAMQPDDGHLVSQPIEHQPDADVRAPAARRGGEPAFALSAEGILMGGRVPELRGRPIKVNIDQLQAGQDGFGSPSTTWVAFAANVPAFLEELNASEKYGDQQIEAIERFDIVMRYVKGVTEKMRVTFVNDGRTYLMNIENVKNWETRNRITVLRCKTGVNRG